MKKIYSLLAVLLFSLGAMATQYCNTEIKSGDNSVSLSCLNPEEGVYAIVVIGEGITGVGGSFCYINENETYQLNAEGNYTISEDGKIVVFEIQSTTAPVLYTPLYILMPGEVTFAWPDDVEWVAECEGILQPVEQEEAEVIYKWDGSGAGNEGVAEEQGGKMSVYLESGENILIGNKQKGNWTVKLNKGYKDAEQYSVIIELGKALAKGDKLTLGAFKTTDKAAVLAIEFNADKENLNQDIVILREELQQITTDAIPEDEVIDIPEAADGMKYIRLYRKSGNTGIYVSKFGITRAEGGEVEPQPVKQMLNNPIGADGRFIVKWDCENEKFAESNDFEVDETFTFAIDITGTEYEEFVKQVSNEGATRALAFNKWSDIGGFNGDAVRLLPIKENIYGATFNLFQQGGNEIKAEAAVNDVVVYVSGQVFCYEYTEDNPTKGWWIWPGDVKEFKAVDSDCFFATLPYTGTKTSPEFVNSDMPGLFEYAYGTVPGYGIACGVLEEKPVEDDKYPTTAAPDAETDFPRVASVFSDRYGNAANADFYANWEQSTQVEYKDIDGDNYLYYSDFNYQGWQFSPVVAAGLTNLHISIWAPTTGSIGVVPIYGGEGLTTDDSHRVTLTTEAGKWVEYNIDLAKDLAGLELGSIFQFKFDNGVDVTTFAIDNVYFYNPEALVDEEAPKDLKVEVESVGYFDATLKLSATDNSGVVYYGAFLVYEDTAILLNYIAGTSGAEVLLPIPLETNTTYSNIIVIAEDEAENLTDFIVVPELTTLAGPDAAPAPLDADEDVISLYSDAYLPAAQFTIGNWGQATRAAEVELAEGDEAMMLSNFNYLGWEINDNVAAFDASEMTHLHLDVWAPDAEAKLNVTPIWAKENGEKPTSVGELKAGWNQISMPLSTWEGINLANIYQIKFDGGNSGVLFLDNVYFVKVVEDGLNDVEGLDIRVNAGRLTINTTAGERISIYNVAGQLLNSTISTGCNTISLPQGQVVIVRIADRAAKVVL